MKEVISGIIIFTTALLFFWVFIWIPWWLMTPETFWQRFWIIILESIFVALPSGLACGIGGCLLWALINDKLN